MRLAPADVAALKHCVAVGNVKLSVNAVDTDHSGAVKLRARHARNSGDPLCLDLLNIQLAAAANADDIRTVAVNAVLGEQLVEAVGIAGLEENEGLALKLGRLNHIFGEIRAAEAVVDKFVKRLCRLKISDLGVMRHVAAAPAEHADDGAVGQQLFCAIDQFLHRMSSSLTLGPSS